MGDSDVGLILGLGLDPSGAKNQIDALGGSFVGLDKVTAATGEKMGQSFGGVDKNILSNRESARLLTEELGIHMPRGHERDCRNDARYRRDGHGATRRFCRERASGI